MDFIMFKIIKWIIFILIGLQIVNYFMVKKQIPKEIILLLERNSCEGYEVFGMDLPFSFLINTKTKSMVYLRNTNYPQYPNGVDLEVNVYDTDVPLLKGKGNLRYKVEGEQIYMNFSHCYDRS